MVETINQKIVKARKEHKCSWCHGVIKVGEEYENATMKSPDHGLYVWKNHRRCKELADGLDMWMHGWDGLSDDDFAECVQDYLYENNWFTGEEAHEDFQDWYDEQDWGSEALRAYEIYKGKQVYKAVKYLFPDTKSVDFTTEYPSAWSEEIGYIGAYTGHKYEIKKVDKEETGVEFIVTFEDHPGITGGGDTVKEALHSAKEGLDMWLEIKKEDGLTKEFLEKDRSTINIKDDDTLGKIDRFIWVDKDKEDGE